MKITSGRIICAWFLGLQNPLLVQAVWPDMTAFVAFVILMISLIGNLKALEWLLGK